MSAPIASVPAMAVSGVSWTTQGASAARGVCSSATARRALSGDAVPSTSRSPRDEVRASAIGAAGAVPEGSKPSIDSDQVEISNCAGAESAASSKCTVPSVMARESRSSGGGPLSSAGGVSASAGSGQARIGRLPSSARDRCSAGRCAEMSIAGVNRRREKKSTSTSRVSIAKRSSPAVLAGPVSSNAFSSRVNRNGLLRTSPSVTSTSRAAVSAFGSSRATSQGSSRKPARLHSTSASAVPIAIFCRRLTLRACALCRCGGPRAPAHPARRAVP